MKTNIAKNLRIHMFNNGMRAADLARAAGIKPTSLHSIIKGKTTDPRVGTLIPLAETLGTSIDDLVKGVVIAKG